MAASSIPDLNSLRKPRGGLRGGFGKRRTQVDPDQIVRSTDDDAASSRISAVQAGYLDDPFAKFLSTDNWQPRLPLMNRGTYIRTTALDRIVETFLGTQGQKQIVSLGAGSDTRYFRLKRRKVTDFTYHELDFRENTSIKIDRLKSPQAKQVIKQFCGMDIDSAHSRDGELDTDEYHIRAIDLRALPKDMPWLKRDQPTLLISECCLIYLPPDQADQVLSTFTQYLTGPVAIAIYEPFRPDDSFGRTMIRNLTTRGIVLETIQKYATLDAQVQRLTEQGLQARAQDTEFMFRTWIDQEEKDRIDKLEWMDEVEEFVLLAKHYCIAWGWRDFADSTWQSLPS